MCKSGVSTNYLAKYRLQLIRVSASLGQVLTDELELELSHIIHLNTGFIPRRVIRLRQTNDPSQMDHSSLI